MNKKYPQYYIGHTTNNKDRQKASSGGIGTCITRYLLSQPEYGTSITFVFEPEKCMYVPKLIHFADEINVCGSIYQDIDIVRFIRDNINKIKDGLVVSCPPCQIAAMRQMLKLKGIKHFILSYCCSRQTTIEGTWCYYRFLGINKDDVTNMQYRGNGWPSGIQIKLKNGTKIFHANYTEPWSTIHESRLFCPKRCFYCKRDTGYNADIVLADPWLNKYKKSDFIGNTLFLINTNLGSEVLGALKKEHLVCYEESNYNTYATAQRPNIRKEIYYILQKKYIERTISLISNKHYFNWATKSITNMQWHILILRVIKLFSSPKNISTFMNKIIKRIRQRFRANMVSRTFAKCSGNLSLQEGVIIKNPQCIHAGKNVGIGAYTYLGPVTEYAEITYNPKIIIGDHTWIGKHCSIAAIDRVELGQNILFAGYVHITDHSHGYEDINRPITPQPLISKGPVIIEDDCWLGFGCEILSGVHIGRHCVVAARAVVTKDVPPYSIVAGNPARIVKQFNFETKKWEKTKK